MINETQTIEQLENDYWTIPEYESSLVVKCCELRKVPINKLTYEDIRLLIGQGIGIRILIPIAIEILKNNIMIETEYYPGDLLLSICKMKEKDWNGNEDGLKMLKDLVKTNKLNIEKYEISEDLKDDINEYIERLDKICI